MRSVKLYVIVNPKFHESDVDLRHPHVTIVYSKLTPSTPDSPRLFYRREVCSVSHVNSCRLGLDWVVTPFVERKYDLQRGPYTFCVLCRFIRRKIQGVEVTERKDKRSCLSEVLLSDLIQCTVCVWETGITGGNDQRIRGKVTRRTELTGAVKEDVIFCEILKCRQI